ncbi:MAG: hypothetical protein V1661_01975 [bacterium]
MEKKRLREFCREHRFWLVMVAVSAILVLDLNLIFSVLNRESPMIIEKISTPKEKEVENTGFVLSSFNAGLILRCVPLANSKNHCTEEFEKSLKGILKDLDKLGIWPFDGVIVDVKKFDKCADEEKKDAGCLPYFKRDDENRAASGYNSAFISLPASVFRDKATRDEILTHELVHAMVSKYSRNFTRNTDEFFAIYAQIKLDKAFHNPCNGPEWNQPALASYDGDYAFPPKPDNRMSDAMADCRYGHLEYVAGRLDEKFPDLYLRLWATLSNHKMGPIGSAQLKKWIKEINPEAGKLISRFHIFKQANAVPKLAVVSDGGFYCFFIFQSRDADSEDFCERSGVIVSWLRHSQRSLIYNPKSYTCLDAGLFGSGATVHLRATAKGKELFYKFTTP